jgi:hypothetical protein
VDLRDDLHRIARSIARDRGLSLSAVMAEHMRHGLLGPGGGDSVIEKRAGFPTVRVGRPVTSEDVRSLDDDA